MEWRYRTAALSLLVAIGCGETSRNGDSDPHAPSTGGSSNSLATANTATATGNSTQGDGGSTSTSNTSSTSSNTNAVTAVSAGGASVATSTDVGVSTTLPTGGSGGSAGGGAEPECSSDDDCRLFSDCCTCAAYPTSGEPPEACPAAPCAQGRCEQYQIDGALCLAGSCVLVTSHECSPLPVECDSLPPECADGTLPSVGANRCWTGDCVPSDLCGSRPDCGSCAEGEVCFRGFNDAFGTPYYCMPRPVTCSDQATCGCANQLCEALGFRYCTDADDGVMQCSP